MGVGQRPFGGLRFRGLRIGVAPRSRFGKPNSFETYVGVWLPGAEGVERTYGRPRPAVFVRIAAQIASQFLTRNPPYAVIAVGRGSELDLAAVIAQRKPVAEDADGRSDRVVESEVYRILDGTARVPCER